MQNYLLRSCPIQVLTCSKIRSAARVFILCVFGGAAEFAGPENDGPHHSLADSSGAIWSVVFRGSAFDRFCIFSGPVLATCLIGL